VTVTDTDGVTGTNPAIGTVSTWAETGTINVTGRLLWVDDATGSDTNDGLSESAAFKTIQAAADVVIPGDTVTVKDGTYREHIQITRSGLSTNYIHFKAQNALGAIIKGPLGSDRTNHNNRLIVTDASYLRIDGFYLDAIDTNSGITISESSKHVVVENLYVINANGEHADNAAGTDAGSDSQSAEGYSIRLGGDLSNPGSNNTTTVESITVQDNEIVVTEREVLEHGGIESATINLGNHVIRRNKISFTFSTPATGQQHGEDCIHHQENSQNDAGFNETDIYDNICINSTDDGIELDAADVNLRVWGNTVYGQNLGTSLAAVGVGPAYVFRNVYHSPQVAWTTCVGIKTGENSTGFAFVYHNTFDLDCPGAYGWVNSGNRRLASNQVFRNNIMQVTGRAMTSNDGGGGEEWFLDSDYNFFNDEDGGIFAKMDGFQTNSLAEMQAVNTGKWANLEDNSIAGVPTFVDSATSTLANRDYRQTAGSPALDVALVIPGFNDANSGWPFTGSAPDMGAFEFVTTGTDLAVTMSDAVDPVAVNGTITYTVTVTNNGPDAATGVLLTDTLPGTASFLAGTWTSGSCNASGATVTCSIGAIANGASVPVTITATAPGTASDITNTASVTGTETDPSAGNNSTTEDTAVGDRTDLAVTKASSPDPVQPGATLTYTVTVTNNGPDAATGVVLTDTLPGTVIYVSASATSGMCSQSSGTVTCNIGAIANGASEVATIIVTAPGSVGDITNTASVTGDQLDPVSGNDATSEVTQVPVNPTLPIRINAGGTAETDGNSDAWLADQAFDSADGWGYVDTGGGGSSNNSALTLTDPNIYQNERYGEWRYDINVPNGSYDITLYFVEGWAGISGVGGRVFDVLLEGAFGLDNLDIYDEVGPGALLSKPFANVAVSDGQLNIDFVNGAADSPAVVGLVIEEAAAPEADLGITLGDSPDPVIVDQTLTYTLTATNNGPDGATGVVVTDVLPTGVAYVSGTATSGTCSESSGVPTER
jgi:uncharacterized repeat protein (TIGR01451 family)